MSRLIDADVMHREIDKYDTEERMSLKNIKIYINTQPTAYSIDKVIEQLEETFDRWGLDEGKKEIMREIVRNGAEW